jgi:hypothetical protein
LNLPTVALLSQIVGRFRQELLILCRSKRNARGAMRRQLRDVSAKAITALLMNFPTIPAFKRGIKLALANGRV